MKFCKILCITSALLSLMFICQPVWADMEFEISCEGTRSTGGGTYEYQYTLKNISGAAVTLTDFIIGTEDPNALNYTFIPTAGFAASIIPNSPPPPYNVLYSSGVKTPHQVVMPLANNVSAARILWIGSAVVPDQATITFAFNHPNAPLDEEWHVKSSGGWTISQTNFPIAGPIGIYSVGYVHAPGPEPATIPTLSTWGLIVLVALLLLTATWVMMRKRESILRIGRV